MYQTMTEGHEDDFLVRVRAQVMTRDESTEGWLPLAGGGLANVSIRKRARLPPDVGGHEYIIYGQRISDQTIILSCVINRDLQYNKVMPTFHHWRAGKQRNGLTFQTAADARAFDKGIIRAYDDLIDGINMVNSTSWSKRKYNSHVGEDDVFMTLDLPLDPSDSRSSSEGNGSQNSGDRNQNIHIISDTIAVPSIGAQSKSSPTINKPKPKHQQQSLATISTMAEQQQPSVHVPPGENYSYVQLTAVHDYNYPVVDEPIGCIIRNTREDSPNSIKKRSPTDVFAQSLKETHTPKNRMRCRYCHEFFTEEFNQRGACQYAPDIFKNGLEQMTGMKCARCMLYHCMSDSEGETPQHPCECVLESGCTKRWIGLACLSIIVPCLWCYPPFRACHWIGVSCGICGGKHQP